MLFLRNKLLFLPVIIYPGGLLLVDGDLCNRLHFIISVRKVYTIYPGWISAAWVTVARCVSVTQNMNIRYSDVNWNLPIQWLNRTYPNSHHCIGCPGFILILNLDSYNLIFHYVQFYNQNRKLCYSSNIKFNSEKITKALSIV